MKWFQHDTDASHDAKLKKLILRHGAIGYAVYFHCLELVAGDISQTNINFELEHDAEIIADDLKITGDNNESGIEKVNRIMKTIIGLGLFTEKDSKIFCYKLALRLDNTVSRSPIINTIKEKLRINYVGPTKKLGADKIILDKNKSDKKRIDKKAKEKVIKNSYLDLDNVKLKEKEYNTLITKYGLKQTTTLLEKLSNYKLAHGKKYDSDYGAINSWVVESTGVIELNKVAKKPSTDKKLDCWHCKKQTDHYLNGKKYYCKTCFQEAK